MAAHSFRNVSCPPAILSLGGRQRGMGVRVHLKLKEDYDASFELDPERDCRLRALLSSEAFCKQVSQEAGAQQVSFIGEIFQPVPWSPSTPHGMPKEFEQYLHDRERYTIVNVPPNYMFQAKVFKPSRLCAIYKKTNP